MTYKDLISSIDTGENQIFLVYGEEKYIIDEILSYVKSRLDRVFLDLNLTVVDDKNVDMDKLVETLESTPFIDNKRLVIIKNSEFFKTGSKNFSKEDEKKLVSYIENPAASTILIFVPGEIDKRSSIYKAVKKNHTVYEAVKLDHNQMVKWCNEIIKKNGFSISLSELDYFIDKTGYFYKDSLKNLQDIENELKKLSFVYQSKGKIENSDIDSVVIQNFESNIFKLIDYIFKGNPKDSLILYNGLIKNEESALMVLTMISRQILIIAKYFLLSQKGYTQAMAAQKLSVHPYVLKKAAEQASKIDYGFCIKMLNLCLDTEYRIKTGQISENIGVELIIGKISQKIKALKQRVNI